VGESAASTAALESTPPPGLPKRSGLLTTLAGLAIGFGIVILPAPHARYSLLRDLGWSPMAIFGLFDVVSKLIVLFALPAFVLLWERRPLRSMGLARFTATDFGLGLAAFAAAVLINLGTVLAWWYVAPSIARSGFHQMALLRRVPIALMMATLVLNGFTEEMAARGYAIERLSALSGSTLIAAILAFLADLAVHIPFWGLTYPLLIAPTQLLLLLLYLWRRELGACIIAHILIDIVPFLFPFLGGVVPAIMYNGYGHWTRARQYYDKREYAKSADEFSTFINLNPDNAGAYDARGDAYWGTGDYRRAIADLTKSIRIDPLESNTWWDRSCVYMAEGDYAHAASDADEIIRLAPQSPRGYSMRAYVELTSRDYDAAIADLGRALRLDPKNTEYLSRRAYVFMAAGRVDRAIVDDSKWIQSDPNNAGAYDARARAFNARKDYVRALADLDTAIKLDSNDVWLYSDRGETRLASGGCAAARKDFEKALAIDPSSIENDNSLAWTLSTCPQADVRDGKRAIELATKACRRSQWKQGEYIDTLAAAYAEADDFPRAIDFEKKAIAASASDPPQVRRAYAEHLESYERRRPWRKPNS
jgi:tetratricopeptide (TPR) repeat protein